MVGTLPVAPVQLPIFRNRTYILFNHLDNSLDNKNRGYEITLEGNEEYQNISKGVTITTWKLLHNKGLEYNPNDGTILLKAGHFYIIKMYYLPNNDITFAYASVETENGDRISTFSHREVSGNYGGENEACCFYYANEDIKIRACISSVGSSGNKVTHRNSYFVVGEIF